MLLTTIFVLWLIPSTAILQLRLVTREHRRIILEIEEKLMSKSGRVPLVGESPRQEIIARQTPEPDTLESSRAMVSDLPRIMSFWFSKNRELTDNEIIYLGGPYIAHVILWDTAGLYFTVGPIHGGFAFIVTVFITSYLLDHIYSRTLPRRSNTQNIPPADGDVVEPVITEATSGNTGRPVIDEGQLCEDGPPSESKLDEDESDKTPDYTHGSPPNFQLKVYPQLDGLD